MSGLILPTEHSSTFKALTDEATEIIYGELGPATQFSNQLYKTLYFGDGPSYAAVEESSKIIRAAARAVERKRTRPPQSQQDTRPFASPARIAALRAIEDSECDLTRLIELCREINVAASNECHMATAMLLRTIIDHVPPVLDCESFAEVANNYGGAPTPRSFKASMRRLQESSRNIADMHLHSPISPREDLPTEVQVNFAADLDVLLGEVIRVGGGS